MHSKYILNFTQCLSSRRIPKTVHTGITPTAGAQRPLGLRQLPFCASSAPQQCFKNGKWRETYPWEMMNTYLFKETCTQHRCATHAVHATHRFLIQECAAQPHTVHASYRQGTVLTPGRDLMHSSMQPRVLACSVHPMPVALCRLRYRLVAAHNRRTTSCECRLDPLVP